MEVHVTLFETLKKHQPEHGTVRLGTGARVADLLTILGISKDDVGILIVNRKDMLPSPSGGPGRYHHHPSSWRGMTWIRKQGFA